MLFLDQQIAPSTRAHMESQFKFASEMSKQLFGAVQKINELNVQIAQSAMQETFANTREILSAEDPYVALSIAAGQVQPAADRLREYQHHLTDIAAKTQVDLTKTAEAHVPEATRTASAVADEVARRTVEETQKATQRQKAAIEKSAALSRKPDTSKGADASVH